MARVCGGRSVSATEPFVAESCVADLGSTVTVQLHSLSMLRYRAPQIAVTHRFGIT